MRTPASSDVRSWRRIATLLAAVLLPSLVLATILLWLADPVTAAPAGTVLYRVNNGNGQLSPADGSTTVWSADTEGSPSPYLADPGSNNDYSTGDPIDMTDLSVQGGPAPEALFQTERYNTNDGTPMAWEFPITDTQTVEVRLYLAEVFATSVGARIFDVAVEGTVPAVYDDIDIFALVGHDKAVMLPYTVTVSDGTLDVDLLHGSADNPKVNGIEIVTVETEGVLSASPSSHDYGSVALNNTVTQTVTLENASVTTTIHLSSTAISGSAAFDAPNISTDLAAGATTTLDVTFTPTATGSFNADLVVEHDGSNSPVTVGLTGEGYDPAAAPVSFDAYGLQGESLNNPTSLEFGPDGRLYVAQQDGMIYAYTITRTNTPSYDVLSSETIDLVQNIINYNDDGTTNASETDRQVTGLVMAGTASNPVIYVSSSDPRISVDEDLGLDTNSGIISRLTWNGASWERVDIVRGLPRSEENHSTNGLDLDAGNNILYVAQGGHTNKGAPASNFAGTPEYFFAGAILSVDLDAIEAMEIYTDPRTGEQFIYDLPTLDDPQRANIDNTDPNFPYPMDHPWYTQTIDPGDPFGGNNGSNMAVPEPGGPVQIYAPGFRNPYDVLLTTFGQLYTYDNGPNGGWGGLPLIYDSSGTEKGYQGTTTYDPGAGDYCTNLFNEDGSSGQDDTLHYIDGPGYYGGHPVPIRAFPELAGIYIYEEISGSWQETANYTLTEHLPSGLTADDFPTDTGQCNYDILSKALATVGASTNGLAEYVATNFGGAMQGDLLAASFDGNIYRYQLNAAGDAVDSEEALFSGFGSTPLDVTTQGDGDVFPGTVWAATYGADNITVFEPIDFVSCTGDDDPGLDEDGDGYDNADEIDNGTDPCSAASQPPDVDNDGTSDLNDPDDDNDGIVDGEDAFAIDADNGTATQLPIDYPFFNNDPGTGFFGLGFTGLMTNGSDYLTLYDPTILAAGGASGKMTVEDVTAGDAYQTSDSQENGFQFGIDVDTSTQPFIVHTNLESPFFDGDTAPEDHQSFGLFIGDGGQTNYLKIVFNANGGSGGIEVLLETNDSASNTQYTNSDWGGTDILSVTAVDLYLEVDPQNLTVQPRVSVDGGATTYDLGSPIAIPASWLDANDEKGMAVGIISTATNSGETFGATWDFINVDYAPTGAGAFVGVTLDSGIDASSYTPGSFMVTNQSVSQDILTLTIDLSSALLPDMVFDPADGTSAGDSTNKCLEADSGVAATGYVAPGDNCVDPFSVAHQNGYYQATLHFTDFNPGESFSFSVDVDPTSIQGSPAPGPGGSGSVSGLELTGSAIDVEFSDLSFLTSDLYRQPSSLGGGQATITGSLPTAPTINVVGLATPTTTSNPTQTVVIDGPANAEVALLVAEGAFFVPSGGAFDADPYEANSVVAVNEYTATLDSTGTVSIPVMLNNSDPNATTTYGLNYMTAVVVEPDGDTGPTSDVAVVEYDPNYVPAVVLYRVNAGGPQIAAADGSSPAWSEDQVTANASGTAQTGTPSPYVNSDEIDPHAYGVANTISLGSSVPPAAPMALFQLERWDDSPTPEMEWDFPVTEGTEVEVRLYLAEIYDGIDGSGQRVFDVMVEGTVPTEFNDLDPYALGGGLYSGTMVSTTVTVADGDNLDINFIHVTQNPVIKGIEIIEIAPPPPPEGPVIAIDQPTDGTTIVGDQITVTWSATNTNSGDHVHLILDDNPYIGGLPLSGSYIFTDVVTGSHVITAQVASTAHIVYTNTGATDVVNVTVQEPAPAALIEVTPGSSWTASTYTPGSFQIENTGDVDIVSVTLDLSTAWLPDVVFDPEGTAGDVTGKCLEADSGATATGLTTPASGSGDSCTVPFSQPHNGVDGSDGYDVLTLEFIDFNPGETFAFSTDLDPTSIKNATDTGDAGAISGFEIIGAHVSVGFAGSGVYTSNLYDEGSLGGSAATVTPSEAPAPTIELQGVVVPATLGDPSQTVLITGTPGANFSILQPVARLYIDENTTGYDIDPFEANEALAKSLYSGTFDGAGNAAVPVTLFIEASPDAGPDAPLNHFIAIEENASGDYGRTSNSFVVEYAPEPQAAVCVNAGGSDYTASNGLFFMADTYFTAPTGGTYSISEPISETVDDPLFQSERYGDLFTYTIPITDGTYVVDLMFAELFHGVSSAGGAGDGEPGDRQFSVDLEGATVLTNYDIIAEAGAPLTAITETFTVTVSGGAADIGFYLSPTGIDNAKVSAICVTPVQEPAAEPPTAEAGPDQTVIDDDRDGSEVVTLDGSASTDSDGSIVSYGWSEDGSAIATGVSPNVTFTVGTHFVTLTVTDTDGLTDTNGVTITVTTPDNELPVADAGPDQTVVDVDRDGNEVVTLDGSGSFDNDGSIVSYDWSEGGSNIATGVSPTVTLSVGTHPITLTVLDNDGETDTDVVTVTVQAPHLQYLPLVLKDGSP